MSSFSVRADDSIRLIEINIGNHRKDPWLRCTAWHQNNEIVYASFEDVTLELFCTFFKSFGHKKAKCTLFRVKKDYTKTRRQNTGLGYVLYFK